MSQVRRTTMRRVVFALALGGLGAWAITPAQAGDLAGPGYGPAPYPAPNYGPGYGRGGPCRIVLDRRVGVEQAEVAANDFLDRHDRAFVRRRAYGEKSRQRRRMKFSARKRKPPRNQAKPMPRPRWMRRSSSTATPSLRRQNPG